MTSMPDSQSKSKRIVVVAGGIALLLGLPHRTASSGKRAALRNIGIAAFRRARTSG